MRPPLTPLSAYVAAAPHSMASFFFFPSSSASRRPRFLWGRKSALLPVTVPFHVVTSSCFARRLTEPRSCIPPAASSGRQAGGRAGPAAVNGGLARQPSPTLRRLLAFTTHCAVAGLKVRISHGAVFISRMPPSFQNSAIVQTVSTIFFFFLLRVFAERNKRLSFFQTRQCYCHSFIQNKIGPQSAAGDQSSVP